MDERPKSTAEIQQQFLDRKKEIAALLKDRRPSRRKPNIPAIILLMTVVYLEYGREKYHGQKTWDEYWRDLTGWNHWRHPWLIAGFYGAAAAIFIYRVINARRGKPMKLWPVDLMAVAALVIFGFEAYPSRFTWSDLDSAGWWRHHWPDLTLWGFVVAFVIYARVDMLMISYREKQKAKDRADWNRHLTATVDIHDFADWEDLYAYMDPGERIRLMQGLERMPRGSRSLRKAVQKVCPEMLPPET